ncbi:NYN domain-containing protein [Rhizobium leguminosarum]|uniref:NYN domain-containing protein n=2 Tax=Rhizobium leguminosarum TaxID=384 RepID=UPI0032AFE2B4
MRSPRLTVLIDAFDSTSARIAEGCSERWPKKARQASDASIGGSPARARGPGGSIGQVSNHSQRGLPKRRGKRLRHDADDPCDGLLHNGSLDSFCLLSSDSDFTRFAARIREQGVCVFTCGEQKTGRKFPPGLPAVHLHRGRSSPGETIDEQSPRACRQAAAADSCDRAVLQTCYHKRASKTDVAICAPSHGIQILIAARWMNHVQWIVRRS